MFDAIFRNAQAVIPRKVGKDGRVPRLSEFKNQNVVVVVPQNETTIDATITCGSSGSEQLGLSDVVGADE